MITSFDQQHSYRILCSISQRGHPKCVFLLNGLLRHGIFQRVFLLSGILLSAKFFISIM
jgi:hypothetical protein